MKTLSLPLSILFFLVLTAACGSETEYEQEVLPREDATLIADEQTSTLTNFCKDVPVPAPAPQDYCRTLSGGQIYTVTLQPGTYTQDPETCEISSPDDGMRVSMEEMGFTPCAQIEHDDPGVAAL